jgi:GAG-pre-integrase domain
MGTQFAREKCTIKNRNNCIVAQGTRRDGIYVLDTVKWEAAIDVVCMASAELSMWHARLGHANIRGIENMWKNNVVDGLSCNDEGTQAKMQTEICESCVYGRRIAFRFRGRF